MPKLKKETVAETDGKQEPETPPTFTTPDEATPKQRKVIYPELKINGAVIDPSKLRVAVATAKAILGWETEAEWAARVKRQDKTLAKVELKFANHDPVIEPLLTDENGDKVLCRNNRGNRPYDDPTARQYAQDILNRKWRFNCETVIVGKTAMLESGQHRLVGLVLASQIWALNKPKWQKLWPEEPWIESLVAFGADESPETVQTLDNVRTRTEADTIYTSPIFQDLATNAEKRECSRMLSAAIDLLWQRTGASETADKYKTHAAAFSFLERHKKLEQCVREVFELNRNRAISYHAKLSPGAGACCLYLMGSSIAGSPNEIGNYEAEYRNANPAPSEEKLRWDRWDLALGFFKALADKDNKPTRAVRAAVKDLYDEGNARAHEKLVILAKAWNLWAEEQPIREADLELHYHEDEERKVLLDDNCFGGIDLGHKPSKPDDGEVTEKEVAKSKEEIEAEKKLKRKQLAEELVARRSSQDEAKPSSPATYDKDGKPPTTGLLKPKPAKPLTRKGVEAEQTRAAKEADARGMAAPKKSSGVIVNAGNRKSVK